jgi:hypothetical protein
MKLFVLFIHLFSTCLALGVITLTDMRMIGRMVGYKVVIPPPSRFDTRIILIALLLLCFSGALLVYWGVQDRPDYLDNPKLQAKIALVCLLVANAFVLHYRVFPSLRRGEPVNQWKSSRLNLITASVGLSNSLWLFCAFLGIARPWNFNMPLHQVLLVGLGLWLAIATSIRFTLLLASRDEPTGSPDWIDSMKATLNSGVAGLDTGYKHDFERSRSAEPAPSEHPSIQDLAAEPAQGTPSGAECVATSH